MATSDFTVVGSNASSAAFRVWGSALSAALATVGLVNTTDTGQINWTTVAVASANSDAGYEIWRFNDALQSTTPVFIKFYYGTGTASITPRIRVEVGTGSNGSGTITGVGAGTLMSVANLQNLPSPAATPVWVSSDGSGLAVQLWALASISAEQAIFYIDRFRDPASGNPNSYGIVIMWDDGLQGAWHTQIIDFGASLVLPSLACAEMPIPVAWSLTTSNLSASGQLAAYPALIVAASGVFTLKMPLSIPTIDMGYDSKQIITAFGASRTYRSLGARFTQFGKQGVNVSSVNASPMIWWSD